MSLASWRAACTQEFTRHGGRGGAGFFWEVLQVGPVKRGDWAAMAAESGGRDDSPRRVFFGFGAVGFSAADRFRCIIEGARPAEVA